MGTKKKPKAMWIITGIVLLALFPLGYFAAKHMNLWSASSVEQVIIPDLTGLNEDEARTELREIGLILGQIMEASAEDTPYGTTPDTVIGTIPVQGEKISVGSPITIVVAPDISENLVRVPDATGSDEGIARNNLEEAQLNIRVVESPNIQVDEGWSFLQYPAPGTEVAEGSTVIVVFSSGEPREPIWLNVPSVIGLSIPEATTRLHDYGLEVIIPMEHKLSDGRISKQTPEPGAEVLLDSAVILGVEVR